MIPADSRRLADIHRRALQLAACCLLCVGDRVFVTPQRAGTMTTNWKTAFAATLCAAAYSQPGVAQLAPPTILQIDVENVVNYQLDTSDISKFASDPNVTTTRPLAQQGGWPG